MADIEFSYHVRTMYIYCIIFITFRKINIALARKIVYD